MSKEELNSVLALLEEVRGGDLSQKPLWQQRGEMDISGLAMPMPEGDFDIQISRMSGVPALRFIPAEKKSQGVLLYMHGGGYVIGSAASHRHLVAKLALDIGVEAWSLDYRLAPEWAYPSALDDATSAYRYLLEQGYDAESIVIGGDSAGGGLAACLLVALKAQGLPQPAGAFLLSPWTDMTQSGETHSSRSAVDPLVKKADLDEMAMAYLQGVDATSPTASPLFAELEGISPLHIVVGDAETMLDDSVAFAEKAHKAGVRVDIDVYPDMIHMFPYFWPMLSEANVACDKITAFCKTQLEN